MKSKSARIAGVVSIVAIIVITVKIHFYFKDLRADYQDSLTKATQAAQAYLEETYQTEVTYAEHQSIYDKMIWNITFAEVGSPDCTYEVHLAESLDRSATPTKKNFRIVSTEKADQ